MPDIYTYEVPATALIEQGFSEQETGLITGKKPTILWSELAKRDGIAAIRALTDDQYNVLAMHLIGEGLEAAVAQDRNRFLGTIWAVAASQSPQGLWTDQALHSAVACAMLLRTVQEAFGKSEDEAKAAEAAAFAKKLGVQ